LRSRITMAVALAVNMGNLGHASPARRPIADLVRDLDATIRARGGCIRLLDFSGHTGDFLLKGADRPADVAQAVSPLRGTPCAVVPVAPVADSSAAGGSSAAHQGGRPTLESRCCVPPQRAVIICTSDGHARRPVPSPRRLHDLMAEMRSRGYRTGRCQLQQVMPGRAAMRNSLTHLAAIAVPLGRPDFPRQNGSVLKGARCRVQPVARWLRWHR
jgi:hypothetical protein